MHHSPSRVLGHQKMQPFPFFDGVEGVFSQESEEKAA
jgi:hypothetical protein